jgi:hypothetical protein
LILVELMTTTVVSMSWQYRDLTTRVGV